MDISVITSTYNRKDFLRETIESVQKSVFAPLRDISWEHIIYNDGSTDGTDALFENNLWDNVVYIHGTAPNRGPSYGKNQALQVARGRYVFPLDSDDIALSRTLYNFISTVRNLPKIHWFTSDFLRVDEKLSYILGQDHYEWQFTDCASMLESIFRGEHFLQGNVFFTKELYSRAGKYDEALFIGEDLDLYIRFLLLGILPRHVNFISHLHRFHGGNISKGITPEDHKITVMRLKEKYYSSSSVQRIRALVGQKA